MKNTLRIFVSFAVLFCLGLPGPAISEDIAPDIGKIQKRGRLIVAMYKKDMPPYFMKNRKGELFGFDIDMARDIAKKMGVELEVNRNAQSFHEVVDFVNDRKADLAISKLSITWERAVRVRFSRAYATINQVLILNRMEEVRLKNKVGGKIFPNHQDVRLGADPASSYWGFAQSDYGNAQLVAYENRALLLEDIYRGAIPAALLDENTVKNWLHDQPDAGIRVRLVMDDSRVDPMAIAVNRDDTHLLSWLNTYLDLISLDGTLNRLTAKYLKSDEWRKERPRKG